MSAERMKIHEQITPETWCQGSYGIDKHGRDVAATDPDACSWCAAGWIWKTCKDGKHRDATYRMLRAVGADELLGHWNDHPERTFEEVRAAFKKADL